MKHPLQQRSFRGRRILPVLVLLPLAVADAELLTYWDFNAPGSVATVDARAGVAGIFRAGARISDDQGGRTGAAGDRSAQFGPGNHRIEVADVSWAESIATTDAVTVTFWLKQNSVRDATVLRLDNPATSDTRAISAHLPWSNGNVYFDTTGCCGAESRLDGPSPDGISWNQWHHIALIKNGDVKEMWIDGELYLSGTGFDPFSPGFTFLTIGNANNNSEAVDGNIDDLAFFDHALSQADIQALAGGASPATLATTPTDSDGDGLPDLWEYKYFPGDLTKLSASGDFDGDGMPDKDEYIVGTNPIVADTDGDGLADGVETGTGTWVSATDTGTNPLLADSDGDALSDGVETRTGTYVNPTDTGTDPNLADTDGDGIGDYVEILYGSSPVNAASVPVIPGVPLLLAYWSFNDTSDPEKAVDSVVGYEASVVNAGYTTGGEGRTGAAGDEAITFIDSGQRVNLESALWLNLAAREDRMTVSFWQKLNNVQSSSSFWFVSPSSSDNQRGYQAHVPWGDGTIYFDSAGCCGGGQRLSGYPDPEPDYYSWTHFAFVKNGSVKEVWINGEKVLEGDGAAPLPSDFTALRIGSDNGSANIDGMIDDFAVYAGALSGPDIARLAAGASPTEIGGSEDADGDGLPDAWENLYFPNDLTKLSGNGDYDNDGLTDGQELARGTSPVDEDSDDDGLKDGVETGTGIWAGPNDRGTDPLNPDTDGDGFPDGIEDNSGVYTSQASPGTSPLLADTDGDGFLDSVEGAYPQFMASPVSAASVPFPKDSPHLLAYWPFDSAEDPFLANDVLHGFSGFLENGPEYTPPGGGRTGQGSDRAVFIPSSGRVLVEDAGFINLASALNSITVSYWQRLNVVQSSSAFWIESPSSTDDFRGMQVHSTWGDGVIYFDHGGCCDTPQRVQGPLPATIDLTDGWHNFVVIKNGDVKQVWADGELVLEGASGVPLPLDLASLSIGSSINGGSIDGDMDDFAIFAGTLTPEQVARIAAGESPQSILGTPPPVSDFRITGITRGADGSITISWTADPDGGPYTIESATALSGWTAVQANISSGTSTVTLPGPFPEGRVFFRVRK